MYLRSTTYYLFIFVYLPSYKSLQPWRLIQLMSRVYDVSDESEPEDEVVGECDEEEEKKPKGKPAPLAGFLKKAKMTEGIALTPLIPEKWSELKHCQDGKDYIAKREGGGTNMEIFRMCKLLAKKGAKGKNWLFFCHGCGSERTMGKTDIVKHAGACELPKVPINERDAFKEALVDELRIHERRAPTRDVAGARAERGSIASMLRPSFQTEFATEKMRTEYLNQSVAEFFLACGLAPNLANNPFFHVFIEKVAAIKPDEANVRGVVSDKVDELQRVGGELPNGAFLFDYGTSGQSQPESIEG